LAVQAELKLADALFKKKEFEEALEVYREFEKLHPKNKSIPYVVYLIHFPYRPREKSENVLLTWRNMNFTLVISISRPVTIWQH